MIASLITKRFCTTTFSTKMIVKPQVVKNFCSISGDCNPLHWDQQAGKKSRFGRSIAHGMVGGSLIETILAQKLPQYRIKKFQLKFKAPVFFNDQIEAFLTLNKQQEKDNGVQFDYKVCKNDQKHIVVIIGKGFLQADKKYEL